MYKLVEYKSQDDYQYGHGEKPKMSSNLDSLISKAESDVVAYRMRAACIYDESLQAGKRMVVEVNNNGYGLGVTTNYLVYDCSIIQGYIYSLFKYLPDDKNIRSYSIMPLKGKTAFCVIKNGKGQSVVTDDIEKVTNPELKGILYNIIVSASNLVGKPLHSIEFPIHDTLFASYCKSVEEDGAYNLEFQKAY